MRIDQLLLEARVGSKKSIKKLLQQKRVCCDEEIVTEKDLAVDSLWFNITVDGKRVGQDLGHQYWLVNKPAGYVSANHDENFLTIVDCLPVQVRNTHLAISGRLDRDSTGLVLMTNNGQLHYLLQQDRFGIEKEYEVTVNGWIDDQTVKNFQEGVIIDDHYQCKPAELNVLQNTSVESKAIVVITEGKRHQIKKMFLSQGVRVTRLHRVKIGPLEIGMDLKSGMSRQLTATEITYLKQLLKTHKRR